MSLGNFEPLQLDPLPGSGMVSVALAFPGPEVHEAAGNFGFTALFLEILRSGAGILPEEEIARKFDEWGSGLHAFCGDGACGLRYSCLPEVLGESLRTLSLLVEGRFQLEKSLCARESAARVALIQEERDDPSSEGLRQMRRKLLGSEALGLSPLGSETDLRSATEESLMHFGEQFRERSPRSLGISGEFDPDSVRALAESLLDGQDPGGREPLQQVDEEPLQTFREIVRHPREQSVVVHAFRSGGYGDSSAHERQLALSCLNGLSGPLFEEIRERHGLAYYSTARLVAGRDRGLIAFVSGCEESQTNFLLERLQEILQRIAVRGFSDDEFSAGVAQCRSGLLLSRQRSSWRAQRLAVRSVQGLNTDLGESSEAFYDSATPGEIKDWWSEKFSVDPGSTLFLLPQGQD